MCGECIWCALHVEAFAVGHIELFQILQSEMAGLLGFLGAYGVGNGYLFVGDGNAYLHGGVGGYGVVLGHIFQKQLHGERND